MRDIDEMIERLLVMELIGGISGRSMEASLIVENKDRIDQYGEGLSAEEVYVDMLRKIVDAPTSLHICMSARLLIPIVDQKLREEEHAVE